MQEKPAGEGKAKAAAANGHDAEEWRTADPYAMFPQPADNRAVHTSIPFSDAPTLHVANTAEQLEAHLKVLASLESPTEHTWLHGCASDQAHHTCRKKKKLGQGVVCSQVVDAAGVRCAQTQYGPSDPDL